MPANANPQFLLASPEPTLLAAFEPVLAAAGARVEVVLSGGAALAALTAAEPPALALLDVRLTGMPLEQLLAASLAETGKCFPIVLVAETVTQEWIDRLAEGVIDDLIPPTIESSFLRLRVEAALLNFGRARELEMLREGAALNARTDRLTGLYNREAMLSLLFRETDRVQRMKSSLSMILFDIDDFGHWNARLGSGPCDELLCQVASRTARLLRSYDLLGRMGKDEFLLALPGCSSVSAVLLAERVCLEIFSSPFQAAGESVRLSACFGIASSLGRSPVVVLRDAEQALQAAKVAGPESIQCADCPQPAAPVAFLSPSAGDDFLSW